MFLVTFHLACVALAESYNLALLVVTFQLACVSLARAPAPPPCCVALSARPTVVGCWPKLPNLPSPRDVPHGPRSARDFRHCQSYPSYPPHTSYKAPSKTSASSSALARVSPISMLKSVRMLRNSSHLPKWHRTRPALRRADIPVRPKKEFVSPCCLLVPFNPKSAAVALQHQRC